MANTQKNIEDDLWKEYYRAKTIKYYRDMRYKDSLDFINLLYFAICFLCGVMLGVALTA